MQTPLRIVLVHRYFYPDTPPYATILLSVAKALAAAGHDVTVLTCQPSYNRQVVDCAPARENIDGVEVVRWPVVDDRKSMGRKLLNLVMFALHLMLARRTFRDAEVVMAATTPPVLIASLCSLLARQHGARFIYHKQDIYPEVVQATGQQSATPVNWILRQVDRRTDRRADRLVVLSDDMKRTSEARGVSSERIAILNNFDPWEIGTLAEKATEEEQSSKALNLVFAGNLGRFQGLEALVNLIHKTKDESRITWHFFGDGPMKQAIAVLADDRCNIVMHGYQPAPVVASFVSRADLGIVSLHPGVITAAYPSKTMTYLRQGCPILALVDEDSELASMVRENRIGLTVDQRATGLLASQLQELIIDRRSLDGARERARTVYVDNFSPEVQLKRWIALFEEVATL
ncbi:glycosyltransferase family 4 protein [Segeticoccus rhizosphaerae]|uniref:glycosyltransferase family 4 protein n=1 Tax=Segeticoccus rhizosphaerae TaxID=1104777 RepID=UPI0010C0AAF4|nr:glycosyltransferase family 4 protein [Ornithinicoccus soli]